MPASEGVGEGGDGDEEGSEENDGGDGWASKEGIGLCLHRKLVQPASVLR